MKLKKLLKLVSKDTKIRVIFEYKIVVKPCDYSKYEDLKVEQLRLIEGTDALSVDGDSGILYVYINSMGYYYNAETDKYEKTTVNVDNGDQDDC